MQYFYEYLQIQISRSLELNILTNQNLVIQPDIIFNHIQKRYDGCNLLNQCRYD